MAASLQVVFDAADPASLARFWATALGYEQQPPPDGHASWEEWARSMGIPPDRWNDAAALVDPSGSRPRIFIQRVPEPKTAKNRVHLDIGVSGGSATPMPERRSRVDAQVQRLVDAGASVVGPVDRPDEYWVVMQDPEGNEFCIH